MLLSSQRGDATLKNFKKKFVEPGRTRETPGPGHPRGRCTARAACASVPRPMTPHAHTQKHNGAVSKDIVHLRERVLVT